MKKNNYYVSEPRKISKEGYERISVKIKELEKLSIAAKKELTETIRNTREVTDSAIGLCREKIDSIDAQLRELVKDLSNVVVVNIGNETSQDKVEIMYNKNDFKQGDFVEGCVSRKKNVIPLIMEIYEN